MRSDELSWDEAGLVAAIVQDAGTGDVLMLGWMNRQALELSIETGRVHFWSRSRGQLWEKGESSGHRLDLVSLAADCDGDALLVRTRPHGPTCHTGSATCFGERGTPSALATVQGLWETIQDRAATRPEGSYTARLLAGGPDLTGRKVVEEATEVLMAAKDHATGVADDRRLAEEAADLIYHLLVLLAERGLDPAEVGAVLAERAARVGEP